MTFTRGMVRRLPAAGTSTNEADSNEMLAQPLGDSRNNTQTIAGRSTAVFDDAAEGSVDDHANAFSTNTGSHGALQTNIDKEDQSSSTGARFSDLQTALAMQVSEPNSERNAEAFESREPQSSGLSTEESQNPRGGVSSPPPTKSKARKRRGHRWSRKKVSKSSPSGHSEGSTIPTSKKRRIGEADAEDHELRQRKRQRVTEPVAGPSSVVPFVSEGLQIAINGGTTRDHEMNRNSETAVPGWAVESPRVNDALFTGPEVTPVNVEEQEEIDFLLHAPGPFDYHPGTPVDTPTSESKSRYNSDPGTPGLMAEDNENRRGESNSVDSTPVRTPHVQSIERSPTIVPPGVIEDVQPYWAVEEGDEEEDENDASESVVVVNRERSMAPSPPSLSPSHPTVHPATGWHVEEPQVILWPFAPHLDLPTHGGFVLRYSTAVAPPGQEHSP